MSQHDLNIANQGFPAFRADLNDALVALGSTNSGATAPATTYANQLWYDTANNILKIRNEDNDAWISLLTLDQSADTVSEIATAIATLGAGSASNPALTTAGDSNTGIFFPAADTIAFAEGGVEVMRINNSGQVMINTTTNFSGGKLTVAGGIGAKGDGAWVYVDNAAGTGFPYISPNGYYVDSGFESRIYSTGVGNGQSMLFSTSGTERMRIGSNGNIGIGTTSTDAAVNIYGTNSTASSSTTFWNLTYSGMVIRNSSDTANTVSGIGFQGGSGGGSNSAIGNIAESTSLGALAFYTGGSGRSNTVPERMRITSDGTLRFDSGYGSVASAYGCRAWVNFNGTGTVAIRASGNVSSITDQGVGIYTLNFTTAMPDANFAAIAINDWYGLGYIDTYTTGSVNYRTMDSNFSGKDVVANSVAVFR